MPFISLVISTKGRCEELGTLFRSLQRQSYRDFDVIIVDQNSDDRLRDLSRTSWGFPLTRICRPADRGLSRGRNVGWRASAGEVLAFPDDDCWYDPDFLSYAVLQLRETQADVLTGRAAAADGRSINGRFASHRHRITERSEVWTTQIEWVAFFRRELLVNLDGYDVDVGIGALSPWQACEGQEIVLRALEVGAKCWYDPKLVGRHAEISLVRPDKTTTIKGRGYARGMGYVLRKHRFGPFATAYWILRPTLRAVFELLRGRALLALYYSNVCLGRVEGVLKRTLPS